MSPHEDRIIDEVLRRLERGESATSEVGSRAESAEGDAPLLREPLFREYSELTALLPYALEPLEPDPQTRSAVLGQVAREGSVSESADPPASVRPLAFRPRAQSSSPRWLQALAAGLAVAVLGLGVLTVSLYRNLEQQASQIAQIRSEVEDSRVRQEVLLASESDAARLRTLVTAKHTRVCPLSPPSADAAQPAARAVVYFDPERREYVLSAQDLAPCTEGYAYRLWFLVDGRPILAKTFNVKAGSPVLLGSDGLPADVEAMMVTYQAEREEEPGGERILYGDRSQRMY